MIFDFDNTFFIYFFLFLSFMFIGNFLFFKPYLFLKEERLKRTEEKEEEIKKLKHRLADRKEFLENKISTVRQSALLEREKRLNEIYKESESLKKEADLISEKQLSEVDRRLKAEYQSVLRDFENEIDVLAEQFAKHLIDKEV